MIRPSIYKHPSPLQSQPLTEPQLVQYNKIWQIFHAVISTGDTYTFSPETPKQNLSSLWFAPYMHTYVYQREEDGQILGTYIIKANQPDLGSHIANASFMVNPEYQGKGIGKKLCQHCLTTAKKLGFQAMQFNIVVSTNQVAVALWKKFGFQIIGTIPEGFNNLKLGKFVDAHIMYRKL